MFPDNLFVVKIRFHPLLRIHGMKRKKTDSFKQVSLQVIILLSLIVSNTLKSILIEVGVSNVGPLVSLHEFSVLSFIS